MKNFLPIQYQFQSQKSFVAAEQTKVEAKAISDSNSGFLMVQWPRPLCSNSEARGFSI